MSVWLPDLLAEFRQLPAGPKHLPTIFRVVGCERKEDAWSNVLAFFLDPGEPHGLGTLLLDALARAGKIPDSGAWTGVSVEREKRTNSGNRIDILIESDGHVIVIENKVFAGSNNPFPDYASFARSLEPRGRHVSLFLLTRTSNKAGKKNRFCNVIHANFVKHIRVLLGQYVAAADTRYLTLLLDFLNTVDPFRKDDVMDSEFLVFLQKHHSDVETLLKRCYKFKSNELRNMVRELKDKVGEITGLPGVDVVRDGEFSTQNLGNPSAQNRSLDYELKYEFRLNTAGDFRVTVRAIVSPQGWEVRVADAKGKMSKEDFRNWLQSLNITASPQSGRESLFVQNFPYEDLSQIAGTVRNIVQKLASGQA